MPRTKKTIKVEDQKPIKDPRGGGAGGPPKHLNSGGGGKDTQRHHRFNPN
jgi:hypothetical protein